MNNIEASDSKNTFKRTFKMDSHITSYYKNVVQASFFDLYDDVSVLLLEYTVIYRIMYLFVSSLKGLSRHFAGNKKCR
jgi:hypothetical protein